MIICYFSKKWKFVFHCFITSCYEMKCMFVAKPYNIPSGFKGDFYIKNDEECLSKRSGTVKNDRLYLANPCDSPVLKKTFRLAKGRQWVIWGFGC